MEDYNKSVRNSGYKDNYMINWIKGTLDSLGIPLPDIENNDSNENNNSIENNETVKVFNKNRSRSTNINRINNYNKKRENSELNFERNKKLSNNLNKKSSIIVKKSANNSINKRYNNIDSRDVHSRGNNINSTESISNSNKDNIHIIKDNTIMKDNNNKNDDDKNTNDRVNKIKEDNKSKFNEDTKKSKAKYSYISIDTINNEDYINNRKENNEEKNKQIIYYKGDTFSIIDKSKINELKEKLNNIQIENNNFLKKNYKLENEILIEKNKIKELEEKVSQLIKELEKEKKISQKFKDNLKIDTKQSSIYETIFKKDKEIENLKLKLSRYPFELEEGEKLMSVIITSKEEDIVYSVICKNTDKFSKIENIFLEKYIEYSEIEYYFTHKNENKIKRPNSLQENRICDNDIITLNVIEQ